tara:strand:- start:148 stop:579 length:432 start_codon:yes stop_codon:yes gene_type:complete
MNKEITEIGSGGFSPGSDSFNLGRHRINTLGPSSGADSNFSRMSQFASRKLDVEEDEEDEDDILESRVYKKGKYCLIETLDNINETEPEEETDDEEIQEFSGVAASGGGPATPIGYTAKGKPETPTQRRKRQRFNITKSFPYT